MREIETLSLAHDGPIPPAALAASMWGRGAEARLARAAESALIEARLRAAVGVLARLRSGPRLRASREHAEGLRRLVRVVAAYRLAALACRATGALRRRDARPKPRPVTR